jgi:hypothetical protein
LATVEAVVNAAPTCAPHTFTTAENRIVAAAMMFVRVGTGA